MSLTIARAVREALNYNPESGVFSWRIKPSPAIKIGDAAGYNMVGSYCLIGLNGVVYYAHRLAVLCVTGKWPEGEVDHRDGNKENNAWTNLLQCDRTINSQNIREAHSDSSTGFLGVSRHRSRFDAAIHVNGKRIRLGRYDTPEQAHAAYISAKRQLHAGNTI